MGLRTSDQAAQLSLFGLELASSQVAPTLVAPEKPLSLRLITGQQAANPSVNSEAAAERAQQRADLLALNEEMLRSVRLF